MKSCSRSIAAGWMQFALNRDLPITLDPAPDDVASVEAAVRAFSESGLRLSAAILAVGQTDAILRR